MEENTHHDVASLDKRAVANRRNARLSTGPKTEQGKSHSRRNALKHGILASAVLITAGEGAEDPVEFNELLGALRRDLVPVGMLEEMLVEKIAVCWWRQERALRCEAGIIRRAFVRRPERPHDPLEDEFVRSFGPHINPRPMPIPELEAIKDHLRLPLGPQLDQILRYETTIQRQLVYAINQLERLRRIRKGEHVPAPVSVQLSNDE